MRKINEIRFELTHQCLLNCYHCPINAKKDTNIVLSLEKIKDILKNFDCEYVGLSGGEPLLYNNIEDIVWWLKSNKYKVVLYSTGYVENALIKLKTLKALKLDKVVLYYHNSIPNIHNYITRIEDSHMKTYYAIKYCISIGLDVEIYIPPSAVNIYTLDETVDDLIDMGISKIGFPEIKNTGRVKDYQYMIPDSDELTRTIDFIKRKNCRCLKFHSNTTDVIFVTPDGRMCEDGDRDNIFR